MTIENKSMVDEIVSNISTPTIGKISNIEKKKVMEKRKKKEEMRKRENLLLSISFPDNNKENRKTTPQTPLI